VRGYDPKAMCRCGHSAYWHGAPRGGERGTGMCENGVACKCTAFVDAAAEPVVAVEFTHDELAALWQDLTPALGDTEHALDRAKLKVHDAMVAELGL
jgi:hypothetical protein